MNMPSSTLNVDRWYREELILVTSVSGCDGSQLQYGELTSFWSIVCV